jgi:hypothetical protein
MRSKDIDLIFENYSNQVKKTCAYCGNQLTQEEIAWNLSEDLVTESKVNCNGYIIYHGKNYVCIATGLVNASRNEKTGAMVQVFIIRSDVHPVEAIKTGKDATICFNCPHRGTSCYVEVGKSVGQVYNTYKRGNYPFICKDPQNMQGYDDIDYYLNNGVWEVFSNSFVRFGAYGDPVRIPYPIVEKIASVCKGYTGYTHQWNNPAFQAYNKYFMASADSLDDYANAKAKGWRTFRVTTDWRQKDPNEIVCLNSREGTQCIDCLACGGTSSTEQKDIYIKVHGTKPKVDEFVKKFGDPSISTKITPEEEKEIQEIEKQEQEAKQNRKKPKDKPQDGLGSLKAFLQSREEPKKDEK